MKSAKTFRLDIAIATWRNTLQHERFIQPDDLDELEQHVRDQVTDLIEKGYSEAEAFQMAMETMGPKDETEAAFRQTYIGTLKRERRLGEELAWRWSMTKNYVQVAFRHVRKQKGYAFINILGLAIGLTCFVLIGLFVRFELSYDRFHEKADRIYRIGKEIPSLEVQGSNRWLATPAPLAPVLLTELPEVEQVTQIIRSSALFEVGQKLFNEEGLFATQHFFDVFSFRLVQGNANTVLADPSSIVLTESLAEKYFGDKNPVGEIVSITFSEDHFNGTNDMLVSGVVEDPPINSHFSFGYLVSDQSSGDLINYLDRWDSNSYATYVVLNADHDIDVFSTKLNTATRPHIAETPYYQNNPEHIGSFFVQPLTDIYLHSNVNGELHLNSDIRYIYLLSAIGILILLIACINYINLATARSSTRFTEVGVRKVMGAHRKQLIGQFMGEAIAPALIALTIALFLVFLLLPTFVLLTGRTFTLHLSDNIGFLTLLLMLGLGIGILAGGYPAILMSSFNPVGMMKGVTNGHTGRPLLRNILVIAQFATSIVLVICTIVLQRQMHFVRTADTGIDRAQVVSIEVEDRMMFGDRYESLKQSLLQHATVRSVTAAQTNPTNVDAATMTSEWEGAPGDQKVLVYRSIIQHDYVDLFGIEVIEGRNFSPDRPLDAREGVLINETLKKQLGWEDATDRWFNFYGSEFNVIGVVKDFNFHSFHRPVAPIALFIDSSRPFGFQRIFVKISPAEIPETLAFLEETMREFSPEQPFEYTFLDDAYNQMYHTEARLGSLLSAFTLIALFIACLGLLGLAMFTARKRFKEIGVRKVLGASPYDILVLLSKEFTRLVMISFFIAAPIAFLAQQRWLQEFAYQVPVGWGTFLLAGSSILLIAWLTVSFQALRAALVNPVDSIRYE